MRKKNNLSFYTADMKMAELVHKDAQPEEKDHENRRSDDRQ